MREKHTPSCKRPKHLRSAHSTKHTVHYEAACYNIKTRQLRALDIHPPREGGVGGEQQGLVWFFIEEHI